MKSGKKHDFDWANGRQLVSVGSDIAYTYDENGIRTSKEVDGTNSFFFEYSEDKTPLGFVLNDTQYLYITNNSSDVMAIADISGNIIATYSYNERGVSTVNATGDQNIAIANLNPLRYRGYYYDSETGYTYIHQKHCYIVVPNRKILYLKWQDILVQNGHYIALKNEKYNY